MFAGLTSYNIYKGAQEASLSTPAKIFLVGDSALVATAVIIGSLILAGIIPTYLAAGVGAMVTGGVIVIADSTAFFCAIKKKSELPKKKEDGPDVDRIQIDETEDASQDYLKQVEELTQFLFADLIHQKNLHSIQPLGRHIDRIEEFLKVFNLKHQLHLQVRSTMHSDNENDPWQTLKFVDCSVTNEGEKSAFLSQWNDYLYETHGLMGNGGDDCIVIKNQKKREPVCFKKQGTLFFPQLHISLIDIRRILGMSTLEVYFQELQDAYKR